MGEKIADKIQAAVYDAACRLVNGASVILIHPKTYHDLLLNLVAGVTSYPIQGDSKVMDFMGLKIRRSCDVGVDDIEVY